MSGQGYEAGAIIARLEIDKGKWNEAIQAVKNDQKELADVVTKGNVPLSQFGDLLKKYGVQTAQDARASIATLRGDQVLLDTAFRDGVIGLGGYQKATKDVEKQLKELNGAVATAETGHKSLVSQIALGQAAYNVFAAAARGAWNIVKESVQGAIDEEKAERALTAALELSGRTVEGNKQHYLDFAMAQHRVTLYTHEQVEEAQALLIQYLKLDQEGTDKATKGAIGLASALGIDLQSAAQLVTRAINNDTESIGRMKLHIDESLPPQEKQAAILNEIVKLYGRATAETDTFGGRTIQLKKTVDEIKESIGKLIIVAIEPFVRLVGKAAQTVLDLIEANDYLKNATKTNEEVQVAFGNRLHDAALKAGMTSQAYGILARQAMEYDDATQDVIKGLQNQGLSQDQIKDRLELVGAGYIVNTAHLKKLVEQTEFGAAAMKNLEGAARPIPPAINQIGTDAGLASEEMAKFIRSMSAEIAAGGIDQYKAQRVAAQAAYKDRLADIAKMQGTDKEFYAARAAAAAALAATLIKINRAEADDEAALAQAMFAAATDWNNKNKALLLERGDEEAKLYDDISAAEKKCEEEQLRGYDVRQAADAKLHAQAATLGRSGLALELANLKLDEAAAVAELQRKAVSAGASYAKEISLSKAYYAELARLAKQDQSLKIMVAAWNSLSSVVSAVTASMAQHNTATYAAMQKRSDDYFSAEQTKLDAESTKKLSDLDAWYAKQKQVIEDSTMDEAGKKAAQEALDKEYATKKAAAEKEATDKQAKLAAEKSKKDLEIKRLAFEAQKRINVANAIMSTANAIISAAQTTPFFPFAIIAMAAAAAAGAVQLAAIRSVPMPLAKGAAFKKETEFYTSGGGHYVAGEEGIELMAGGREIRSILRQELGGERNRGARPILHIHNYFGGKEIDKRIIDIAQLGLDTNQIMVHRRNND